jgi:arginyl-tRNA synthetase
VTYLELPECLVDLLQAGVKIGLARAGAPGRFKASFTKEGFLHQEVVARSWLENRTVKNLVQNPILIPPHVYFQLKAEFVLLIAEHQVRAIATNNFPWPAAQTQDICNLSYGSPNANKPLHLGHARNLALGGALGALLRLTGHNVQETCLFSDYGVHIARAVTARKMEPVAATPVTEKGDHMAGRWYAEGSVLARDPIVGEGFRRLERQLLADYLHNDPRAKMEFERFTSAVIAGLRTTMERFGASFDRYFYESDSVAICREVVAEGLRKGLLLYTDDKAVRPANRRDDPAATLVRADGSPLYLLQSIASSLQRVRAFAPQKIGRYLSVRAVEQEATFQMYTDVWKDLALPPLPGRQIISHGIVYNGEQRMRSRQEGSVVLLDSVLDDLQRHIERSTHQTHILAGDTLRFFLLSRQIRDPLKFTGVEAVISDDQSFLKLRALRVGTAKAGKQEGTEQTPSHIAFALLCCELPAIILYAARHLDPTRIASYFRNVMAVYQRIGHQSKTATRNSGYTHLFEQLTRTVLATLALKDLSSQVATESQNIR